MRNFDAYSRYYDLLYRDKEYSSESEYVYSLLTRYSTTGMNTLLELGCGSGNHARYLSERGLDITGIERSEEMVTLARSKNIPGFNPTVADITDFSLNEQYDAAVSLFHVISYLTDNTDLLNCFLTTGKHLKPGALFLFDVWYTPAVLEQKPETRIKRLSDDSILVTRLAEPAINHITNTVDVHYEVWIKDRKSGNIEVFNEVHPMRHFGIPEIDLLARQTGFELLHSEAFLTGEKPGTNTWGVCFVLKKSYE